MSNLVEHARRELKRSGWFDDDSDYGGMIGDAVEELIELFAKQGHSGMSASIVRLLFWDLSNFKALSPLTDDSAEWVDVAELSPGRGLWQNRRNSEAFSHDGGKTYYLLSEKRRWTRHLIPWKLARKLPDHLYSRLLYPFHTSVPTGFILGVSE